MVILKEEGDSWIETLYQERLNPNSNFCTHLGESSATVFAVILTTKVSESRHNEVIARGHLERLYCVITTFSKEI